MKNKRNMYSVYFLAVLIIAPFYMNSCAISKTLYLNQNALERDTPPDFLRKSYADEDINGSFPEAVYIKTRTQTFNAYHYYIISDGLIWYKSIDNAQEPQEWTLFEKTGLPHNAWKWGFEKTKAIAEIAADADELVALSEDGGFYRSCFDKTIAHKTNVWLDQQGWPEEEQLFLDKRVAKNRAWALGKRNNHVLYYEDPFGNQHHNGTMEIVTTYMLLEDGQEIAYADTGLPGDFSRNYIGPERGAFKAIALSASASTMFVINEIGEMYTRIADFDIIGCDPMYFKYTYTPYTSDLRGDNYFSNLTKWALLAEDWRSQPHIPLVGKAALTRYITILQNGQGNGARELRVAGLNENGETGYWTKMIFADAWEFKVAPLYFSREVLLITDDNTHGERGASLDKRYGGYLWNDKQKEWGWQYEIQNFNMLEGGCDLRVSWRGETCVLSLYPVELWTYLKRDYLPGRTGAPKMFMATLAIPEHALDGLSMEFANALREKYAKNDRKFFQYIIAASNHYLFIQDSGNANTVLFLTDGVINDDLPEFRRTYLVDNYEEVRRYNAPDLTLPANVTLGHDDAAELAARIEANKAFRAELQYHIRLLKWSELTAFKFNFAYIPAHYIARLTPLRFIDAPKIRTVTEYGDRLILTNSIYISTIAETRVWLDEQILELLDTRIQCYNDLAKQLAKSADRVAMPVWYSETIATYWDITGLPRTVSGTFFNPGSGRNSPQTPATLSFIPPPAGQEPFGWYLGIDNAQSFSLFIDPHNSAKAVYARKGKTPQERTMRFEATMHVADNAVLPFAGEDRASIDVVISFDGEFFEIKEHPVAHSNALIFRGAVR